MAPGQGSLESFKETDAHELPGAVGSKIGSEISFKGSNRSNCATIAGQ